MQEFKLPDLGEGMHEAEIAHWLVKPGDTIKLDQPMVEVETDKARVEIPSPVAGRISDIRVQEGQVAKVGEVLVVFETAAPGNGPSTSSVGAGVVWRGEGALGAARRTSATKPTSVSPPPSSSENVGAGLAPALPASSKKRVLAAPAVRKLAFELGVDLEQVTPSHPNGRVTIEDVRAHVERTNALEASSRGGGGVEAGRGPLWSPASSEEESSRGGGGVEAGRGPSLDAVRGTVWPAVSLHPQEDRQPLTGLRKRIAEHMEHAWRTIPHATAFDEADGSGLTALRQALQPLAEQRGVHLTYMPLLVKLLLPMLKEFPIFNASLDEEGREIIYKRSYHIGLATATPDGLLVPVLRNADQLTLLSIASELERLFEGARKRTLSLRELSGSTFTLNNVGSFGGASGTPIINSPEVAILAVGRLQEKAIVRQGEIIARPMMPLALSFDHRLIDGAMAGAFLSRFKILLENPQQLMLDMV